MSTRLRRTTAVATDDGALLHAVADGAADAPVTLVLAHGWTLASAAWDDVAALLAARVADGALRLVRYDQRGHGRSTWPTSDGAAPASIDRLGTDLGTVLDRLVPEGPVVLAGAETMHASTVRAFTEFLPALGAHDKRRELAALARVPVEVLVGDSDKLTPPRHSEQLAEVLPDAALQVVPRTGHMLPQERAALVAEALGRLLDAATGARAAA